MTAFDTHKFWQRLREQEHFSADQADAITQGLSETFDDRLATKTELKTAFAELKIELLKWIIGALGVETIVVLGALLLVFGAAAHAATPDEPATGMTLIYDEPECDDAIVDKLRGNSCWGTGTGIGNCVSHGYLVSYDVQQHYCRVWRSERRQPRFVRAFKKCEAMKNDFSSLPEFGDCIMKNADCLNMAACIRK